jgi:hypothetical protein
VHRERVKRVFQNRPTVDDKLAFRAERIADYTIAMCG